MSRELNLLAPRHRTAAPSDPVYPDGTGNVRCLYLRDVFPSAPARLWPRGANEGASERRWRAGHGWRAPSREDAAEPLAGVTLALRGCVVEAAFPSDTHAEELLHLMSLPDTANGLTPATLHLLFGHVTIAIEMKTYDKWKHIPERNHLK
ncbi:Hypothetical predicted protein [Podarcis lilfordi]|uniref:Uncharacterized protein n=1 Tax=Podarcis lilfordi TaxID=74358 RepID=A0AA35KDU4_9SAUR|nr:Hypothetical predicted protein [Podarcis lilfordi]